MSGLPLPWNTGSLLVMAHWPQSMRVPCAQGAMRRGQGMKRTGSVPTGGVSMPLKMEPNRRGTATVETQPVDERFQQYAERQGVQGEQHAAKPVWHLDG